MLTSLGQLPRYDLAIYAPGATSLYLEDAPAVGGAEQQMVMLARSLTGLGLRVCHIVEDLPGLPSSRDGVDLVAQQPRSATGGPPLPLRALEALRRADAEVYLQRSAGLVTGIVGAYARLRRRHFVYSTSSPVDLHHPAYLQRHESVGFSLGWRLAEVIVVQTREQADSAPPRATVVRIPSLCESAPAVATERDLFLWVGRPAAYKGGAAFVELAREVPEARFMMVGIPDSPEAVSASIRSAADSVPNLEVLPPRPPAELLPLYYRAVAVVNTSDFEGFPNSFMEGWARGALALSLNVDPDSVILTHDLGAIANGSNAALRAITQDMWHRRREPDVRRGGAVAYVRAHHSPPVVATRWYELVRSIQHNRAGKDSHPDRDP